MKTARERRAPYTRDDTIIDLAQTILLKRLRSPGEALSSPTATRVFLRMAMRELHHEEFHVLFLDVKNRLIAHDRLFRGTLTQTSVYPREVVKVALKYNAASVMLAHNHPSGSSEPSEADLVLTRALVQALALVDVRVLDHFIVAGADVHSFAEHGQL